MRSGTENRQFVQLEDDLFGHDLENLLLPSPIRSYLMERKTFTVLDIG